NLGVATLAAAWPWIAPQLDESREALLSGLPFGSSITRVYNWMDYAIAVVLDVIRSAIDGVIPAFFRPWVDTVADFPIMSISLIVFVIASRWPSSALGQRVN